ncbi:MAG: ATP-binding protein [Kofleriaceae bacterium]
MSPNTFDEPIRVLVVDDDAVDRATIKRYLVAAGVPATIDELDGAADLVARVTEDAYDCLILDHHLPGETAFDVLRRLREAQLVTPILCVTGEDEEVGAAIVAAGASDFLSKQDLSPARLARRLRYVLRLGRAERQARRVRVELDAQRRMLDAVIAQLPAGVLVVDAALRQVLLSNVRAAEVVGVDGVLGDHPSQPALVSAARDALARAISTNHAIALDGTHAHGALQLRVGASPITHGGRVVAGMLMFDDVTAEVTARRAAERAARAREDLLAIVSHDLRGPLSAIGVALDGLRDPGLEPAARERYASAVQRSLDRAERLIRDLLMAHRIEVGQLELERRTVTVRSLLDHVCREHELVATQAGTALTVDIADDVGAIYADPERLGQAFANLIGNALRHARGTPTIALSARRRDDGGVILGVRDHGPGVSAEALPHVFDRYWQGRERRGGAGLGLAIVRGIARAHGGDAGVAEAEGGGAVFTIELPPPPPA